MGISLGNKTIILKNFYKKQNETDLVPSDENLKTPTFEWKIYSTYEVDSVLANYFIENGMAIDFFTEIQNPTLSVPINLMSVRVVTNSTSTSSRSC